ncbi:unnamed protein product [Meloidogyne enterolobii]|uniref:Uncharacterized protein n=1 Tax=Meloidogyne enterolobii TaxID=390850 RepID=A0ACB0XVR7_MELEN
MATVSSRILTRERGMEESRGRENGSDFRGGFRGEVYNRRNSIFQVSKIVRGHCVCL